MNGLQKILATVILGIGSIFIAAMLFFVGLKLLETVGPADAEGFSRFLAGGMGRMVHPIILFAVLYPWYLSRDVRRKNYSSLTQGLAVLAPLTVLMPSFYYLLSSAGATEGALVLQVIGRSIIAIGVPFLLLFYFDHRTAKIEKLEQLEKAALTFSTRRKKIPH